ncbi:amino acid adenylation domain-containing protein [Niabella yanshanensis]|uniref:Amino acid adenylation domain-containing protein n=1 Tax=Niabella yanshanensis TaxID=577386 RepID=A0ABZ0WBV1_9BACT|nr:non-ribosomal peptide synthetase [Niabella yanshanensis]WQD39660.1 amino acid adenylation domain-containing protein [Niabella yanshanensis]
MSHSNLNTRVPVDFDPFDGDIIQKVVPCTESQKEVFASCLLGGEDANLAYNLSMSLHFTGELNTVLLKECAREVVKRHESLRASFSDDGSKMIIYENQDILFDYYDLTSETAAQQQKELEAYLWKDASTTFDIIHGPLIRFALFQLNDKQYSFVITVHHLVCDGWSLSILLEDLSRFYNAKIKGTPLPVEAAEFSKYAVENILFEQTSAYKDIVQYWKKEYEGTVPVFEIPPDFPRPPVRTYKGRRDDYILPAALADQVKETGVKYGASFVSILMAAFEVLLQKYTGHEDIVIGLPTSGQAATENFTLVGHCVNLLPLRSNPLPETRFADYLHLRKSKLLQDYEKQRFTFGSFLKELKMQRDLSRMPLAPVSLNIDLGIDLQVGFEGLEYKLIHNKRVSETYELFLNIADHKEGYELQWSYNTQLYSASTIKGLMEKYSFLLSQIVENPEKKIIDLKLQSEQSLTNYWTNWNGSNDIRYKGETLAGLINDSSLVNAEKTALEFKGVVYTYREISDLSNKMAHSLIEKGVQKGVVVGVAMDRSVDLVLSLLAVVKAGGVFVPLDPQYARERIEYMLENSGAEILLTSTRYKSRFTTGALEVLVEDIRSDLSEYPATLPNVVINPDSLVYILYTSGSTGRPKGVMIANKSLVNYISWAVAYYLKGKPGAFPLYTSISFDLTITSIFSPLVSGSLLKIYEEEEPVTMLEKIFADDQINVVKLTPSHLKLVKDSHAIRSRLPAQFITLIVGGEELETSVSKEVHELFNGNVLICNEYGPTEATVGCMIYDYTVADQLSAVPIGVPISNANIYLLDSALNLVPKGITGEIYIGGVCVAEGYYKNEALTRERFLPDPFVANGRMYKTGDNAVMLNNDVLLFKGRIDDQVKLRGYRIELGEIDYHLSTISGIKNVVTVVRSDSPGNEYLASYVVLKEKVEDEAQVKQVWREILRNKLPDYMVPGIFVIVDELPLTQNGKVDKKRLPAPEMQAHKYVAPQTNEELLLAEIWKDVFGKEEIGLYDNFFELGGHSLLAVRVTRMLEKRTGIGLPLTTLFRYPVLQYFAAELANTRSQSTDKEPVTEWYLQDEEIFTETFPATEPQLEIWQNCIIGGDEINVSYNVAHAEYLNGNVNMKALENAFQEMMRRHELLRATFSSDGAEVYLKRNAPLPLFTTDISALKPEEQEAFVGDFLKKEYEKPFDLEHDILFRVSLVKLSDTKHLLLFVIHHLICDGGSFDVIIREVSQLYNGFQLGHLPELDKAVKFSSYALHEQKRYRSERYARDQAYWISKFDGDIPEAVDLASKYPDPGQRTFKSAVDAYMLSASETEAVEKLAANGNTTLTILLRTLFEVFIYKQTGQKDFVIGLPATDHLSVSGYTLIGHTINMLPVRTLVSSGQSFRSFLERRRAEMLSDFDHQKVTFGSVLKKVKFNRAAKNKFISVSFGSQFEKVDKNFSFIDIEHETAFITEERSSLEFYIDTYKRDGLIYFQIYYQSDLFDATDIQSLMNSFRNVINQVTANPGLRISNISLANRESLFTRSLASNGEQILEKTIIDLFRESVLAFPKHVAVRLEDQALTYEELNSASNRLAHYLLSRGLQANDRVAIILERGIDIIVSIVAVLKCGAAYIPIDPNYPGERVTFLVEDADAQFMISSGAGTEFSNGKAIGVDLATIEVELNKGVITDPEINYGSDTLAYILYTSGSTGKPKGAMVTHRNLVHFLRGMQDAFQITDRDKFLSVSSISFDASCFDNYLCLVNGAELVLTGNETVKDGQLLLEEVLKRNISIILATPITFKLMLTADWSRRIPVKLLSAGETLLPSLAKELLPRCQALYNVYGPTETTVICTLTRIMSDERITIGAPILDTPVYILDENLKEVAEGEMGEIYIGGEGVSKGYWQRADLTATRFVRDPFANIAGAKMYKSGDLGRFKKNGEIKYEGRIDNQVKIRGFRIELGEIEYHLSRLNNVKDVVATVLEDHTGEKAIVAYIIPQIDEENGTGEFSKETIVNWGHELRVNLPYFMVPSYWVKKKVFPLSPNGKVDVKQITPPDFQKRKQAAVGDAPAQPQAAISQVEQKIMTIWEEELGINGLTTEDNFFELGGHSMIAVKVMNRISREMGVRFPIATLFQHPTIVSIAKLINADATVEQKILVEIKKSGSKPPIYLIHGGALNILLYKNLEPFLSDDQPLYGIQALGLDGDTAHLDSIETISARYLKEILVHNAEGPYIIIGYSYGGVVAYEMARQLMAMGKKVKMLGILDTNVGGREAPANKTQKIFQTLQRQSKKALFIGANLFRSPKEVILYQWSFLKYKVFKNYVETEDEKIYDYGENVIEAYTRAFCNYRMKPLDVRVHLFRVQDRIYFLDDPVYLGWRNYTKDVIVYDVSGDHKTFLLPPHNKSLVTTIEKALENTK